MTLFQTKNKKIAYTHIIPVKHKSHNIIRCGFLGIKNKHCE